MAEWWSEHLDTSSGDSNQPNAQNVGSLGVKWSYTPCGDVTTTPAVVGGAVYFPDWGGCLTKLDAQTGALVWSKTISSYTGVAGDMSRTDPAVVGNTIYLATGGDENDFDQGLPFNPAVTSLSARLLSVNATTGALNWETLLDPHQWAQTRSGPLVVNGVVYEGVSSSEEITSDSASYTCCSFRGSVVAVDAATGKILWKTYTVPPGYTGGAIFSTTPAYDPKSNTLYVTDGNNYTVPASVTTCQNNGGTPAQCLAPNDYEDSVIALNASTGAVRWATGQTTFDTFTAGCVLSPGYNCPADPGGDYDFAPGASLFTVNGQLVVGAGQKSGVYWELNAATGAVLHSTVVGPGGDGGGIEFGSATDGHLIYAGETDSLGLPYTLSGGTPTSGSSWVAINPATGAIKWQTGAGFPATADWSGNSAGQLSVNNGVLFATAEVALDGLGGKMMALDANTGKVLWSFEPPGSYLQSSPAIVQGIVYWGSGFGEGCDLALCGEGPAEVYAFSLNGNGHVQSPLNSAATPQTPRSLSQHLK